MIPSADILAVLIYVLAVIVMYHSYKFRGAFKSLLLLLGFLIVGGGIENTNIVFGGYLYPPSGLTIFIYKCPLWVVLGWYLIAYCGCIISHTLIGKGRGSFQLIGIGTELENGIDKKFILDTVLRAALTAYISMLIGLIMDPIAAKNGWWIWQVENIYIHGVPFGDYLGWFLVVFWTLFLYDIIIAWTSLKKKKEFFTSAVWAVGAIVALLLAGLLLMSSTFLFGLDGIKTINPDVDRIYLAILIADVEPGELMLVLIIVLVSAGFVLASSIAPNKMPEPGPEGKIWRLIPPILLLIYWAVMLYAGFLTNSLMVSIGILNCIPLWMMCLFAIKNPFFERT